MNLALDPADAAFAANMRRSLAEMFPRELRSSILRHGRLRRAELARWHLMLDERGWVAPHWPAECGGRDWTFVRKYLFGEAFHLAGVPVPHVQSINLIGPLIARLGSEEQKRRFLPAIRRLDVLFCQGFSEPEAGSDLASLRTQAVRDGDGYAVTGHKMWTTDAQMADWMFCLVRTDPSARKHAGISLILIEMRSPGITVRPITSIDGHQSLNEVFLDGVRVPAANLLGEENRGWEYARMLLANERVAIARVGASRRNLSRCRDAVEAVRRGCGQVPDRLARRLAELEVELKALELTNLRYLSTLDKHGSVPGPDILPSILKVRGAELQQAASELLVDAWGPASTRADIPDDETFAEPVAAMTNYLHLRAASIYGGSNEVQRNIIARALLGG